MGAFPADIKIPSGFIRVLLFLDIIYLIFPITLIFLPPKTL